ncbi:MAG: carboxypeptidase-like regulatory domain-containing protein [Bacteroidales bacterium]
MKKTAFFIISFLLISIISLSLPGKDDKQEKRKIVQLSGLIVTGDSLKPLPYANIWIKNTRRGTISDFYGFFNITLRENDTIRFSSVGFDEVFYIVPDTLTGNRYSVVQVMTRDTLILPETVIYPWPTKDQFKRAFLNVKIPEDDYDRAIKNLARAEMKERMQNLPMDGSMNFRNYMNQQNQQLYYAGQAPPMRLFDPIAWAEFFKAWRDGKFKRSQD